MANKLMKKLLITLGVTLTLGLCAGCDSNDNRYSSQSTFSSSEETQYFEIKWINYGNKVLYTEMVPEGQMPFYRGEIPTRPDTEEHTYVFTGWSPDVVPATEDTKYRAVYETQDRKYDVVFAGGNCTCQYTQTIIKDVPYGTKVQTSGSFIKINGVGVNVTATPSEAESIPYNYVFDRWSVSDGDRITGDTVISAFFNHTDKLFNIRFEANNGGMVKNYATGETDYSFLFSNGKAFSAVVTGGQTNSSVNSDLHLVTYINNERINFDFGAYSPYDDFYVYSFEGWYYNGERLSYGDEVYGNALIEARFYKYSRHRSDLFEYEIDTELNVAYIVGIPSQYQSLVQDNVTIPKVYNDYPVIGVKNAALSHLPFKSLAIPNTLVFIEEVETAYSSFKPYHFYVERIVVEEGSTNFRVVNGVLYNFTMTEAISGSAEMINYLKDGRFTLPKTVKHIWNCAFKNFAMESVDIPNGVSVIGKEVFDNCGLTTLSLHEGLVEIQERAFASCLFESITIPDSVDILGFASFAYNENLKSVHLGANIEYQATLQLFMGCPNLESFTVSQENTKQASYNGAIYKKDLTYLEAYPVALAKDDPADNLAPSLMDIGYKGFDSCGFTTLHLPEGVKRLENMAIYECADLEKVYLPSTITYLGGYCFQNCSNISYMEFAGTVEQFNAITKDTYRPWNATLTNLPEVVCSNGTVPLNA